jgi:disulfide bond formation protein DsbB
MMMKTVSLRLFLALLLGLLVLAACGGDEANDNGNGGGEVDVPPEEEQGEEVSGDVAAGETAFAGTCVSCHGPDAKGLPGLGKDLTTSAFVADNTDAELIAFLKVGRPASDPANTTGVDMPPKGGNPALDDQDLADIVAYLRSIHEE